jgi:putative nucleotidyltransferase with HDIG domain
VGDRSAPNLKRYLPHVLAATAAVIVLPIGLVSVLASGGVLGSVFVSGPLAMLTSLGASSAGSAWWKKRPGAHDLVFADLLIWGWVRRLRTERRLSRAVELLGNRVDLPSEQQIEYFKELASALEGRDPYTHGHTRRVTGHAVAIAERMGLTREQIAKVRTAAAIHDIGKLNTPRDVLNKPGRLSDEEFAVIKRHPVEGAQMAARLGDAEITAMVMHHHERLDGTGYPGRLAGQQIPLGARIIAVADTFDAITSKRPYRGASSHKKGMAILSKEAGTQLDPEAVRAFHSHYSGLRGVAVGSLLTNAPGRLLSWLGQAAPVTKSAAAIAVAGALGSSAGVLAKPTHRPGSQRTAAATRPTGATVRNTSGANLLASTPSPTPGGHGHGLAVRTVRTRHHASAGTGLSTGAPGRGGSHAPTATGGQGGSGAGSGTTTSSGADHTGSGSGSGGGNPSSPSRPSSSPGGGSPSPGGGTPPPSSTAALPTSTPPVTVSTPPVTVSLPPVTVSTPLGPVKTPPVTVTIPTVIVTTPSVTVPSLP